MTGEQFTQLLAAIDRLSANIESAIRVSMSSPEDRKSSMAAQAAALAQLPAPELPESLKKVVTRTYYCTNCGMRHLNGNPCDWRDTAA